MLHKNNNIIFHSSIFNFPVLLTITVLANIFAIYSFFYWGWSIQWISFWAIKIPISFFLLPAIALLVTLITKTFNEKLILTDEYLLLIQGIFSWKQESVRMEYHSIKEVIIEETLVQRILGIGDIRCTTIATGNIAHVTMIGLRNPRSVKDLINLRIHNSQIQTTSSNNTEKIAQNS
jgi:uncharacterized membrane protein YdbT with pleckstrin-like domain